MQVRAIATAAAQLTEAGRDPRPEIMIPLTATVQEMEISRERAEKVLAGGGGGDRRPRGHPDRHDDRGAAGRPHRGRDRPVGGVLLLRHQRPDADDLGASPGTTWKGAFFSPYIEMGIFGVSPFETIDADGVGRLVKIAAEEGRATRPDLHLGVCGEHGGDPASVWFFHEVGLDYVSCSPFRVPIARLEAGRAASCQCWAATLGEWPTAHMTRSAGRPSRPSAPAARSSSVIARGSCTAPRCAGSPRKRR